MGNYLSIPILVLAVALQSGVMPQFRVLGGAPDLVFLTVLAWSVHAPLEGGITWALVGGIMRDLLSAAPTGMSAIGMLLVVFLVGRLTEQVYSVGLLLLAALVTVGTLIQQGVLFVLLWLTGNPVDLVTDFTYVILPTLVYNLIFIWPVYWFTRRIQRRYAQDRRFFT